MSARGLTYTWKHSIYRMGCDDAIRVRLAVMTATGMPHHVFAYRMFPVNPVTAAQEGVFSHVCSPVDLAAFPVESPTPGASPAWFRLAFVDLLVRSIGEAVELIRSLDADLLTLRDTLDRNDNLMPGGEVTI